MCIFNTPIKEVGGTKILGGRCGGQGKRQLVVYRNYVSVEFDTKSGGRADPSRLKEAANRLKEAAEKKLSTEPTPAMILPFPAHDPNSKVDLIDLHTNKTLFADLDQCFPRFEAPPKNLREGKSRLAAPLSSHKLAVERVGSYNISVAYSIDDLRRIDESVFSVAPNVDTLLAKHYGKGFGFIICAFADNTEKHPLAYVHDVAPDGKLFVPTRHHHHGDKEEATAHWDHEIYSYGTAADGGESPAEAETRLRASLKPGFAVVKGAKTAERVLESLPGVKIDIKAGFELRLLNKKGDLPNGDVEITAHA